MAGVREFKGATLGDWLKDLVDRLGESAAGREGESGEFNLVDERARLAAEQADKVAMDNAVRRGELAPRALLESALSEAVQRVVPILESIPAQVKRSSSGIKARELATVKREIDKARTAMAEALIP